MAETFKVFWSLDQSFSSSMLTSDGFILLICVLCCFWFHCEFMYLNMFVVCYRLNMFPHHSYLKILLPSMIVLGDETGFAQRLSGEESACQHRRQGFNPWSGKIPHALEQIIPCITIVEPVLQNPGATTTEPRGCSYWSQSALEIVLHNKRSHRNEKPTHCNEEQPLVTATREKTQHSQK